MDRADRDELRRRQLQARGVLVSSLGYAAALGVLLLSRRLWGILLPVPVLGELAAVTAGALGALYAVALTGLARRLRRWDPHFVYVPLLASIPLLALYMRAVPESRWVLVHGWIAAISVTAGFAALWPLLGLTALYLATYLWVAHLSPGFYLRQELVMVFAVAVASLMCAIASERFRRQRQEARRLARALEEANRRLADLALRDPLTGVYNRGYLEEFLAHEFARAQRTGSPLVVAMLDLDDFKLYNDTQGHLAGDELLRKVAEVLRGCVRQSDVVARYGGEEFTVVLVGTHPEDAARVLERARSAVASLPVPGTQVLPRGRVTVSVGAACFPQDGLSARELLGRADDALYRAKTRGKNRVEFAGVPQTSSLHGSPLAPHLPRG